MERTSADPTVVGWFVTDIPMVRHRNVLTVRRDWSRSASTVQTKCPFVLKHIDRISVDPTAVGWFCDCFPTDWTYILAGIESPPKR